MAKRKKAVLICVVVVVALALVAFIAVSLKEQSSCSYLPSLPEQSNDAEVDANILPFPDDTLYSILSLQYDGEELGIFQLTQELGDFLPFVVTEEPIVALSCPTSDRNILVLTHSGKILWVDVKSKSISRTIDFPTQVGDEEILDFAFARSAEKVFILTSQYVLSFSLNDPASSLATYYFDEPLNSYSKTGISASTNGDFYIVNTLGDGYLYNGHTGAALGILSGSHFSFQDNGSVVYSDGRSVYSTFLSGDLPICLADFDDLIYGVSVVDDKYLLIWTGRNEFVGTSLGGLFVVDSQTGDVYSLVTNEHHLRSSYTMVPLA